ncbi:hypothetical protein ACN42_g5216 [Penicillium freii]|uniref:Uncharacterized protein n=1 Tax=Penicillium freii TaxID=48697 RepID=A0A124GRP7_PENFR|nr:hypothetical protein ACN42_g5216 [Penicillium freii]
MTPAPRAQVPRQLSINCMVYPIHRLHPFHKRYWNDWNDISNGGLIPIMTRPLIHYFSNFLSVGLHALDA